MLVPSTGPIILAALLYLGAGLGVTVLSALLRDVRRGRESGLRRADIPLLLGIVLSGAVIGPVLLLLGLQQLSGVAAALLLNLEAPFTILLAVWFFRDHLGEIEIVATGLIVVGALALTNAPGGFSANWVGVAAVSGACASWAVDERQRGSSPPFRTSGPAWASSPTRGDLSSDPRAQPHRTRLDHAEAIAPLGEVALDRTRDELRPRLG